MPGVEQTKEGLGGYSGLLLLAHTLHVPPSAGPTCAEEVKEEPEVIAANTIQTDDQEFTTASGDAAELDQSKVPLLGKESLLATMESRNENGVAGKHEADEHESPPPSMENGGAAHESSENRTELSHNGKDGVTSAPLLNRQDILDTLRIPRKLPSIIEIKKAIPAHCFVSDTSLSLYYMGKDFLLVALCFLLINLSWWLLPAWSQVVITPAYWLLQGTMLTAIFVVGHDAGHGSFSANEKINNVCGTICHTFVLTPYYMWKLSHKNHHKNTGNMDKDEIFYPTRKSDLGHTWTFKGFGLFIGWFGYLIRGYSPRQVYHFNPLDHMFIDHLFNCLVSLASMVGWVSCLIGLAQTYGWWNLMYYYGVPEMVFGSFIVIITFLHHTDKEVPWYCDSVWENVRGQLSSVDRSYGWCHEIIHNIGTHQIHHLFPRIPHYHLEEATVHFRTKFPELVQKRGDRILPGFWKYYVKYDNHNVAEDDAKIHMYD